MNEENVMQLKRKKGGKPALCNSMDKLGVHYPREISQTKKDKYCISSLCVGSKQTNEQTLSL